MNANTTAKNKEIRKRIINEKKANGGKIDFLRAQDNIISAGRSRQPVWMYFTSKWESNSSFRLYGL